MCSSDLSILNGINRCVAKLSRIKDFDNTLEEYNNVLESTSFELQDINRSMTDYFQKLEIDEERLNFIEDKIDMVNGLKKKYGNTIEDVLKYRDSIESRLEALLNNEKAIELTSSNIKEIERELSEYSIKLTRVRKNLSQNIEQSIAKELKELNMENVTFKVSFHRLEYFSSNGWDKVEFLISTNKGEDLKPLSKIVSGGEMSRIMLGFKRILADYDNIPCLIFDEIDTGISGRTAQIVGEKIKMIANNHQVISISHLPQIAALADTHFIIEKSTDKNKTSTKVRKLDDSERIDELSRLLGGVDLTDTTKLHAKEMLEMSQKLNFTK